MDCSLCVACCLSFVDCGVMFVVRLLMIVFVVVCRLPLVDCCGLSTVVCSMAVCSCLFTVVLLLVVVRRLWFVVLCVMCVVRLLLFVVCCSLVVVCVVASRFISESCLVLEF